ncbi:MAG: FAD-dependent oxidoreductase [Bryobacteraceae bacterium]
MRNVTVAILGGGVAGMSAAHELAERGFIVQVFEKQALPGGKAREIPVLQSTKEPRQHTPQEILDLRTYTSSRGWAAQGPHVWLPGEHGFRFFPSFYRHVVDTMARIPFKDRTVANNLVATTSVLMTRFDKPPIELPCRFPRTLAEFKMILDQFLALLSGSAAVATDELTFFAARLWQIVTSCEERRVGQYEQIPWREFIQAERMSYDYQRLLAYGITRCLVAAKAEKASTRTIGDIFMQILFGIADPAVASSDRVLNQPTNRAWIGPWLDYLRQIGVDYQLETSVTSINCVGRKIRGITVESADGYRRNVTADYYICALPVERTADLISPSMTAADPKLAGIVGLSENVEWMNGIQFYLRRHVPVAHGHVIYLDSPWALTSISQGQFWKEIDLSDRGDGNVRDIISVDISDWDTPGLNGKTAAECSFEEVAQDVWAQLKRSLNRPGAEMLRDDDLYFWHLDPDILFHPRERSTDIEPLLVNYAGTWEQRPDAVTAIPNFFVASDYVRTYTDVATMEAANEAARRAVNGVLDACGSDEPRCQIWKLYEPEVFAPFRAYDQARWSAGLPWDAQFADCAVAALDAAIRAGKSAVGNDLMSLASQLNKLPGLKTAPAHLREGTGRPHIRIVPH